MESLKGEKLNSNYNNLYILSNLPKFIKYIISQILNIMNQKRTSHIINQVHEAIIYYYYYYYFILLKNLLLYLYNRNQLINVGR